MKKIIVIAYIILMIIAISKCANTTTLINPEIRIEDKQKAIDVASKHLDQKFDRKMQYKSIRFSWKEQQYYVLFSAEDNPNLVFQVMVREDFTISEWTNEYRELSADNYYIANFEYLMSGIFQNKMEQIWPDASPIIVRAPNKAIYAFTIPENLNDKMLLKDMEPLIDEYLLIIDTGNILNQKSKADEAANILNFIQYIKYTNYTPDRVVFWYYFKKSSFHKDGRIDISFDNWEEIASINPIILKIEEEAFSSVNISDDRYYKHYFTQGLAEKFVTDATEIWGVDVQVAANLRKDSINEYKIANLRKDISLDDVEYKLKYEYTLEFFLPIYYEKGDHKQQYQETKKVFTLIQKIQESGYSPSTLSFTYLNPNNDQRYSFLFFANWGDTRWPQIESVEDVLEHFNKT